MALVVSVAACTGTVGSGGGGGAAVPDGGAGPGGRGGDGGPGGGDDLTIWPNDVSAANSDPWLVQHHDQIRLLRPRVLLLNFVNRKSNDQMMAGVDVLTNAFREGSRYHGSASAAAQPMLEYQIAKAVDLRDDAPPSDWPYRNSTLYPREDPVQGSWGFDYAALFSASFAAYYDIRAADGHPMDLCELVNAGVINEVWIYGDADVPDVNAAEVLELKAHYDQDGNRLDGALDPCAGNGCFDDEDLAAIPASCTRSIRIGWINNTRGPGCYLESASHGFESTGNGSALPYLHAVFPGFGDFDLDERYGTSFSSWYGCNSPSCISYTGPTSVRYAVGGTTGSIGDYVPHCGNVHVPPNGHFQYDYDGSSQAQVMSTCMHFGLGDGPDGGDQAEPWSSTDYAALNSLAPDCGGGWHIYWMQAWPGYHNQAHWINGSPMKSWWPFLFY